MEGRESVYLTAIFPVSAAILYEHWLEGEKHAAMTGGGAAGKAKVGASFEAWDGYIWGENLELNAPNYLVQTWRTSEFAEEDEDSVLEVRFVEIEGTTELIIDHQNIPLGQKQYEQGWKDHYLTPMQEYFKAFRG